MPDLSPVQMQMCKSNEVHLVLLSSESDPATQYEVWTGDERREPTCTCPVFRFGKQRGKHGERRCKHIEKVEKEMCGWHPQWSTTHSQTEQQRQEMVCPKCVGPTVAVTVMV